MGSRVGLWGYGSGAGLTFVVVYQFLKVAEGAPWGDVEAPTVQGPDLVMLHCVSLLGIIVSNGQGVAPYMGPKETPQKGTSEA